MTFMQRMASEYETIKADGSPLFREMICEALTHLGEQEREAVERLVLSGQEVSYVAREMDLNPDQVRDLNKRGLSRIKEFIMNRGRARPSQQGRGADARASMASPDPHGGQVARPSWHGERRAAGSAARSRRPPPVRTPGRAGLGGKEVDR